MNNDGTNVSKFTPAATSLETSDRSRFGKTCFDTHYLPLNEGIAFSQNLFLITTRWRLKRYLQNDSLLLALLCCHPWSRYRRIFLYFGCSGLR